MLTKEIPTSLIDSETGIITMFKVKSIHGVGENLRGA